jgi:hypothetical protein
MSDLKQKEENNNESSVSKVDESAMKISTLPQIKKNKFKSELDIGIMQKKQKKPLNEFKFEPPELKEFDSWKLNQIEDKKHLFLIKFEQVLGLI